MDASSTPSRTARLLLEATRDPDNRIEGRIGPDGPDPVDDWSACSGVLELRFATWHNEGRRKEEQ
jgi:hypothetical protein